MGREDSDYDFWKEHPHPSEQQIAALARACSPPDSGVQVREQQELLA